MNATAKTTATAQTHEQESYAQVGIGLIGILSAIIGIWGLTCLISCISQYGITSMIKGWLSAVIGG